VDPLARLAAALDPVMRACHTQGERVAVMRAAWAAARVVLDADASRQSPVVYTDADTTRAKR
jgi:hypothetical protein